MADTSHLNYVEEKVTELLKEIEHLRNCDICLIYNYWLRFDNVSDFMGGEQRRHNLTSSESIRRARQKVQMSIVKDNKIILGKYLPTDPMVRKKRGIAEEVYRAYALENKEG
jgi:hypothetical protein